MMTCFVMLHCIQRGVAAASRDQVLSTAPSQLEVTGTPSRQHTDEPTLRDGSARLRVHASPMRKADGHHNERPSISCRDVISHSPREIPCFDDTVLIRRTTA